MKKTAFVFALMMVVAALVGCGNRSPEIQGVDYDPNFEILDGTAEDEDVQTPKITRGTLEGNVYTNEQMGFAFNKPASWDYATDEELMASLNAGAELFDTDINELLENGTAVYDFWAGDEAMRTNVLFGYENLAMTFSTAITEEEYMDILESQTSSLPEFSVTFPNTCDKVVLGNTEFTRAICSTVCDGVHKTQAFYLHKVDGYMAFIIVTLSLEDNYSLSDIEAMFFTPGAIIS